MRTAAACILGLLALSGPALGQEKEPPIDHVKVDEAVAKGANYIREQVKRAAKLPPGMPDIIPHHGMFLYTLTMAGTKVEGEDMDALLHKVLTKDLTGLCSNYDASLTAMALRELDPERYQWRIAQCAQYLADNQTGNGQWGYGDPVYETPPVPLAKLHPPPPGGMDRPSPRRYVEIQNRLKEYQTQDAKKKKESTRKRENGNKKTTLAQINIKARGKGKIGGDNSNSQYASLGIRACMESAVVLDPAILKRALDWWNSCQDEDGGWGYTGTVYNLPYSSMTMAGLGSECIYRFYLKLPSDQHIRKATEWIGRNFAVDQNLSPPAPAGTTKLTCDPPAKWIYFNLYGMERAGILAGTEKFGKHWWYAEGVQWVLGQQQPDGHWGASPYDTCCAILFLHRATTILAPVPTGQ